MTSQIILLLSLPVVIYLTWLLVKFLEKRLD
jgi:hypothetical protein